MRLREKAERRTKLVLVLVLVLLLPGKHWAYASSFPAATPAQVRNP